MLREKPPTTSLATAQELVAQARERQVFCMEAMWTRFCPLIVELRGTVADGVIGDVRSITADLGFVASEEPSSRCWDQTFGGGALPDVGVYPVAFAQMLLGEPQDVSVVGSLEPNGSRRRRTNTAPGLRLAHDRLGTGITSRDTTLRLAERDVFRVERVAVPSYEPGNRS